MHTNDQNNFISYCILLCPECGHNELDRQPDGLYCRYCSSHFPLSVNRPILLRSGNKLFKKESYQNVPQYNQEKHRTSVLIPGASVNLARIKCLSRFDDLLGSKVPIRMLIVGGGRQRNELDSLLNPDGIHSLVYTDIDSRADIDIFCDAHDLPFKDASFDAVITTAVLEHVLYPERVAAQISRVLRLGGLLYSEMPFMQQVHEGAYDFTRYTLSGHKRLFNRFEVLDAGMVAGPGTALVWSIENFVISFASSGRLRSVLKAVTRLSVFWIKYFDYYLARRPAAMDAASCTYLLGRKIEGQVEDIKIIEDYVGSKPLSHV